MKQFLVAGVESGLHNTIAEPFQRIVAVAGTQSKYNLTHCIGGPQQAYYEAVW